MSNFVYVNKEGRVWKKLKGYKKLAPGPKKKLLCFLTEHYTLQIDKLAI